MITVVEKRAEGNRTAFITIDADSFEEARSSEARALAIRESTTLGLSSPGTDILPAPRRQDDGKFRLIIQCNGRV